VRTRAACLFAVGCIALSGCGTGASTVEQQSEATLYYPGSHVIYGDTVPQNVICIDDCHPAGRTVTLEASANAQQIMSWYGAKLRAAGWSLDPYDKGTNPTVRSWQRNGGAPHGYGFEVEIGVQYTYPTAYELPFRPGLTYFRLSFVVPDS